MRKIPLTTAAALALCLTPAAVLANGLAINEQSVSHAGTSYAGRTSNPMDASIIYSNPAGLSQLNKSQITAGASYIDAKSEISNITAPALPANGSTNGDMVPASTVPFGYYSQPINDQLSWGLGIYVPFGVEDKYDSDFVGQAYGIHSRVTVMTVQPTISYQFNDFIAVGLGPTINKLDGKLTNSVPNPYLGIPITGNTAIDIEGDDTALGFNLGVLLNLTNSLSWGLDYHSKVKYDLEGHTTVESTYPPLVGRYKATLTITMPASLDTSFTYHMNAWTFNAGVTWTYWNKLSAINVKNENAGPLSNIGETLNWHDTVAYAFGAAYQLTDTLQLRAGFAVDPSPTTNTYRTERIPVGNRHNFTLGAGWQATSAITLDVVYGHIQESKAHVRQTQYGTFDADYKNSADSFGAQITYTF